MNKYQRGMTLIEAIMFIVIVSVGLAGLSVIFVTTQKSSADPLLRKRAMVAAEQMLEEILLKNYTEESCGTKTCDPNTPVDRQNYNGVSHYNGWRQCGVFRVMESPDAAPTDAPQIWTDCRAQQNALSGQSGMFPVVSDADWDAKYADYLMPELENIMVEITVGVEATLNGVKMKKVTVRAVDNDGRKMDDNERTVTLIGYKQGSL